MARAISVKIPTAKVIEMIEGKIADAEMSILEYFEERELTETPAQSVAPVVEAAPTQRPAQAPVTYAEIIARGNAVTTPVDNPTHGKAATVCPNCNGTGERDYSVAKGYVDVNPCHVCNAAPVTEPAQDDIVTRIEARTAMISRRSWASGGEDEAMELAQDAADTIRDLRAQLDGVLADLRECERGRTATAEAYAGFVKQTEAQVATFEAELSALKSPRVRNEPITDPYDESKIVEWRYWVEAPDWTLVRNSMGYKKTQDKALQAGEFLLNAHIAVTTN